MPVMDGLEASRKILELNTGISIVAMTANIMSNDMENYMQNGIKDCVGKPFTSQELWRCLLKYLKPVSRKTDNDFSLVEMDLEFTRVLEASFVKNNANKFDEIMKALEEGDIKLAHRLVHTLKGVAGQIGKTFLQKSAADVESKLKDEENLVTKEQLDILKTDLDTVLSELSERQVEISATAEKSETQNGSLVLELEPEKMRELLEKLQSLLKRGNPESLAFVRDLRALPDSGQIIQQIEDYDFKQASNTLSVLMEKYELK
jgi:CheY-like chemotaxis protein